MNTTERQATFTAIYDAIKMQLESDLFPAQEDSNAFERTLRMAGRNDVLLTQDAHRVMFGLGGEGFRGGLVLIWRYSEREDQITFEMLGRTHSANMELALRAMAGATQALAQVGARAMAGSDITYTVEEWTLIFANTGETALREMIFEACGYDGERALRLDTPVTIRLCPFDVENAAEALAQARGR